MGALADEKVGDYLTDHFVATVQRVGTFQVVKGVKQGGNVASYFCQPDGTVVHAVAGPVDAATFLREARWAVDVRGLAVNDSRGDTMKIRGSIRKSHLERLKSEGSLDLPVKTLPQILISGPPPVPQTTQIRHRSAARLQRPGQVHLLLAYYPLPRLEQLYPIVFEDVLREKLSTVPVMQK